MISYKNVLEQRAIIMNQIQLKKIVVAGTPGAGKTSLIRRVSEIETVSTERKATDKISSLKSHTTVGMDFGKMKLYEDLVLHLYGTPGQSRFDFMWEVLITRADAYILLVAADRPEEFKEVRKIINFMNQLVKIPTIVGITHIDSATALHPKQIAYGIGYKDTTTRPPFVTLNANNYQSIKKALIVLLKHLKQQEASSKSLQLSRKIAGKKVLVSARSKPRFNKNDFLKGGFLLH